MAARGATFLLYFAAVLIFGTQVTANGVPSIPETTYDGVDPKDFVFIGDRMYFLSDQDQLTWVGARSLCARLNMKLVSIETVEENTEINYLPTLSDTPVWTDGLRSDNAVDFVWSSTNQIITYKTWAENEPDFTNAVPTCIYMLRGSGATTEWYDDSCTGALRYMCEQLG